MFINKEGKLFGRVSIIDILVILVIAVAAFGIYARLAAPNEKVSTASQTIEYKILVREVRQGSVDALSHKSPIYNDTTKEYMGDIVSAEAVEAVADRILANGEIVSVNVPDKFDVTVTVRVDGSVNASGYYTSSNQMITAGSKYVINSKYAKTTGEVISVNEVK